MHLSTSFYRKGFIGMKIFLKIFIASISFIIFITGCSTHVTTTPSTWEQNTIELIKKGEIEGGYFDYNLLLNRKTSLDTTWRYIEIKKILNISIADPKLMESLHNYETDDLYYQLVINNLLTETGNSKKYPINENTLILQILNDRKINFEQKINIIYNIFYYSQADIPTVLKSRIENLLNNHKKDIISLGYGYIFLDQFIRNTIDISSNMTEEEKTKYITDLKEESSRSNPDLIQIYYLYFINQFVGNKIDNKLIKKTLSLFDSPEGGYGTKVRTNHGNNIGTYIAIKLLKEMNAIDKEQTVRIINFVEKMKSNDGMYFSDQVLKPDIVATLLAERNLMLLGQQNTTNSENVNEFLFIENITDWKYKYLGYYVTKNRLQPANIQILKKEITLFWDQLQQSANKKSIQQFANNPKLLESVEYSILLAKEIKLPLDPKIKEILIDVIDMNLKDFQEQNLFFLSINIAIARGINYQINDKNSIIQHINNQFDTKNGLFATDFLTNYSAIKSLYYLNYAFTSYTPKQIIMEFQSEQGGLCFQLGANESSSLVSTYLGLTLLNEINK